MTPVGAGTTGAAPEQGWAATGERGSFFAARLMVTLLAALPRPVVAPLAHIATAWFFLFGRRARAASRDYLGRVAAARPALVGTGWRWQYRHFQAFARAIVDKLDAWSGRLDLARVRFDGRGGLDELRGRGRGLLLVGSHLGNLELCRVIAAGAAVKLNILVHTRHAPRFARALSLAGATSFELIQVTELDAALALELKERIGRGEWVVISGDRVPVHGGRTLDVSLLGGTARLPVGPWVLAGLLECPVYLLFCLRQDDGHRIHCEPFAPAVRWRRATREAVLRELAQRFAGRLEYHMLQAPLQWFNFYPFWK